MGIQGLLPFLANSTRDAHVSEFENKYVAVDAYCWLHKSIYSCAFELAMKKPSTKYVTYCMRYIEMLLHFRVRPILVFDGRHLDSKSETEKKRREERKKKYIKGKELLRAGKTSEGRKLIGESVDVTHELALNLMKECRQRNIDCLVAPYEADSQVAFFSLRNVVDCVITEDSDLLVYGCERVLFKMDTSGRGKLVQKSEIHFSLNMTPEEFNGDSFRYMCILAGCDYLPSLPSIGLANALKFIKMLKGSNIYDALPKLPIYINKMNIKVSTEYISGFKIADNSFKHQLVYDPFMRKQVPLLPVQNDDEVVGKPLSEDLAFQLAVGNIDPISMKKVDSFDPDKTGTGFHMLWKADLLPNAIPRHPLLNSCSKVMERKKRQRADMDFDSVESVTNGLKKPRTPVTRSTKNIQIPSNGFIFDTKVLNEKKNVSKETEFSRYFTLKKNKQENKTGVVNLTDRRKDESDEDYLQRLYIEYFPDDEAEKNSSEAEECRCSAESDNSVLCLSCRKCRVCCACSKEMVLSLQSQELHETVNNIGNVTKTEKTEFCLLDEINKIQSEKKTEEKEESEKVSPSHSLSLNFYKILSKFDSLESESESCKSEIVEKENAEMVCAEDQESLRSPSPVFKIQKVAKVLKKNCSLGNVSDTAGTSTSVYFSPGASSSFNQFNPQVTHSRTLLNSKQKVVSGKNLSSLSGRKGKGQLKNTTVIKTLFQFGFKKR